jgi:hypothetical protein
MHELVENASKMLVGLGTVEIEARRLATKNASASVEVFRPNGEFGQGKPEMYVQFKEGGGPTHLDTVPWDDDLNAGLILLKVKSVSPE